MYVAIFKSMAQRLLPEEQKLGEGQRSRVRAAGSND